ncbi:hypothetical protein G9A89_017928 [Geosiphon pyriformis]|nr:hypothetical protein G9A89_017928 [Geosiphon pyriformis]
MLQQNQNPPSISNYWVIATEEEEKASKLNGDENSRSSKRFIRGIHDFHSLHRFYIAQRLQSLEAYIIGFLIKPSQKIRIFAPSEVTQVTYKYEDQKVT